MSAFAPPWGAMRPLVVVEAPGGCGKTHQVADHARDIAGGELHSLPAHQTQNRFVFLLRLQTRAAGCRLFNGL